MGDDRSRSDEETQKAGGQGKKFFLVGLVGAAVGAVTAMLLTPWRGSEAREKVKEGAQKAGAAAKEGAAKAGAAAREGAAKAGAAAREGAAKAGKAAKEKAAEAISRAKGKEGKGDTEAD